MVEALAEALAVAGEIRGSDPAATGPMWGAVHRLLLKSPADTATVSALVINRDIDGLDRLLDHLRGIDPDPTDTPDDMSVPEHAAPPPEVTPGTMKKAMRAFRRRLKLIRLDHESRLGVGPMTSGLKADFDAILPPYEYPAEVWEALADAGKLRRTGRGFYALPDESPGHGLPGP